MTKRLMELPDILRDKVFDNYKDAEAAVAKQGESKHFKLEPMATGGEEPQLVDTPPRNTIDAWLQEIAKLSPDAYKKLLSKWGDIEGVDDVPDESLREFAISVRSTLDAIRETLKAAIAKHVRRSKR